jgi:cytochrome c biogenesis protein CcmG, thiol:disulfide interchange protein DsbE
MSTDPRVHQSNPAPMYLQDIARRGGIEGERHLAPFTAMTPRRLLTLAGGLALAALLAVGLAQLAAQSRSSGGTGAAKLTAAQVRNRLAGSPAPLAALHVQADELLPGGRRALRARLAALRGWPIVIDKWASWCQPCQAERAVFQRVAADLGRRVAFIGIDSGDKAQADALHFLRFLPLSYPSYYDPSERLGVEVTGSPFTPVTVFYDRHGSEYIQQGAFPNAAKLQLAVERYALDT